MNSSLKKLLIAAVMLSTAVEWPINVDANNMGVAVPKEAVKKVEPFVVSLFRSCSKSTKFTEKLVNKATQSTEKYVNKEVPQIASKAATPRTLYVLERDQRLRDSIAQAVAASNGVNTASAVTVKCKVCHGTSYVRDGHGNLWSCSNCNGTGRVKQHVNHKRARRR